MASNRREFIKYSLSAGLALGAGSLFNSCMGVRRWESPNFNNEKSPVVKLDDTARTILHHASLAPSGHNSQPWRVRIEGPDAWTVEVDERRRLPAVDPDNRELLLSIGAFVENLSIAAGASGLAVDAEGMEIQGLKGLFVRYFVKPEAFLKESYRRQGVDLIADLARQGAGWFIITSPGQTAADLIETGRRFERMALLARERGIGVHPMTRILEEKHGMDQIVAHHGDALFPQFVLRVGYLENYPNPVSLRRPVEWFVTT